MARFNNKVYQHKEYEVLTEEGLKATVKGATHLIEREPDFVKWYFDDFCKLNDLTKQETMLLFYLAGKMGYSNGDDDCGNLVEISAASRTKIMQAIGVLPSRLSRLFLGLENKGVIIKSGIGLYMVSPYVLARGKWQEIKRIRCVWEYRLGEDGRIERSDILEVEGKNEHLESLMRDGVISDDEREDA